APVVLGRPVAGELTQGRQLHALRPILDELPGRQAGRRDAPAEVGECLFRNVGAEGADFAIGHGVLVHGFGSRGDLLVRLAAQTPRTSPRVSISPLERPRTEPEVAPGFFVRSTPEPRRVVDRVGA